MATLKINNLVPLLAIAVLFVALLATQNYVGQATSVPEISGACGIRNGTVANCPQGYYCAPDKLEGNKTINGTCTLALDLLVTNAELGKISPTTSQVETLKVFVKNYELGQYIFNPAKPAKV